MPKYITREFDNSTAEVTTEVSFAAVVPGFVKEGTWKDENDPNQAEHEYGYDENDESLFDSNGVYECKSQAAFKKYIGLVPGSAKEAVAPTLTVLDSESETPTERPLLPTEFYVTYKNIVYLRKKKESQTDTSIGYLKDEGNTYVKVDEMDYDATKSYCVIRVGNEGNDKITETSCGNQMAYELLGLGYTVLYKKVEREVVTTGETTGGLKELHTEEYWEALKDRSVYDFRYITTGGYYDPEAMRQIIKVAAFKNSVSLYEAETTDDENGRGDCIALCDFDDTGLEQNSPTKAALIKNVSERINAIKMDDDEGTYTGIFGPRVILELNNSQAVLTAYEHNNVFPCSFFYLACAAESQTKYDEWYAVAGPKRGYSKYTVLGTTVNFGAREINTLAPRRMNSNYSVYRAVNLIIHEHNEYLLWGNRTAHKLDDTDLVYSHYLNIRQLNCTIKQHARQVCRSLTFDPNSSILWFDFVGGMTTLLERMKANSGIYAYRIYAGKTKKKGLIKAIIKIKPYEAAEDFDVSLYLEDTMDGILVSATEGIE